MRHVRAAEPSCPFCGAVVFHSPPPAEIDDWDAPRLSRAGRAARATLGVLGMGTLTLTTMCRTLYGGPPPSPEALEGGAVSVLATVATADAADRECASPAGSDAGAEAGAKEAPAEAGVTASSPKSMTRPASSTLRTLPAAAYGGPPHNLGRPTLP
jgi:hypothetical protein